MIAFSRRLSTTADSVRVRAIYDGPQGTLLAAASALSGNLAFAERLLRERVFDLRQCEAILDVGGGAGN